MPNTLTPIIRNLTTAFQRVASERASLAAVAQMDFKAEEAALNQVITIPIAPVVVGAARTPAATFTVAADRTVTNTSITITKDQKYPFHLTGDDYTRMSQNPDFMPASVDQALRAWRNEVHSDLAGLHQTAAGYFSASTPSSGAALGTAGTAPFASDISLITGAEKLLNDSLAPLEGRYLFIHTAAKNNLGNLNQLVKANEAGTTDLLRQGIIGQIAGFNVIWGNDVKLWTPVGTGASYVANGVNAAGSTSLVVKTGTGTVLAGDVINVASGGVSTRYVVQTGIAAPGTLVLTSGLIQATADSDVVTVIAASRRNMAFHREALGLAIRLPKLPPRGDMGEHQVITDPMTGIQVRFSRYVGYGLENWEISSAWGVKTVRPELSKIILG